MKILACLELGDNVLLQQWEVVNVRQRLFLVIVRTGDQAIAVELDRKRIPKIHPSHLAEFAQLGSNKEHIEGVVDAILVSYLGALRIADAQLIRPDSEIIELVRLLAN